MKIANNTQKRHDSSVVLHQIADLLLQVLNLEVEIDADDDSFDGEQQMSRGGIFSARGSIDGDVLTLLCRMIRVHRTSNVPAEVFFDQLSALGQNGAKYRLVLEKDGEHRVLGVELGVSTAPMSIARLAHMKDQLERLDELARKIREYLPETHDDKSLQALYEPVSEVISPVLPLDERIPVPEGIVSLAEQVLEYLTASVPVALAAAPLLRERFMLALIVRLGMEWGCPTLGIAREESLSVKRTLDLVARAPGNVVIPVYRISMSTTETYDTDARLRSFYSQLGTLSNGVILTGSMGDLANNLTGGQGVTPDPLEPLILRAETAIPFDSLLEYAIDCAARDNGGVSRSTRNTVYSRVRKEMKDLRGNEQERLLASVVHREIALLQSGSTSSMSTDTFISSLQSQRETFSGLTNATLARRSEHVRHRMIETFRDPGFESYLNELILAQEKAIGQLVARLRQEAFTRPDNQPVRVLVEGTPATGKSQASILIAERLGWPHMTIDCGAIPDYYTFSAQLLGSGRGIVMSNRPGKLETAARENGIVLEVSDLDHAPQNIRAAIGDLFLLCMETGRGQSATGGNFNCANMIIVFTINLPNRRDESVRNSLGYHRADEHDVEARVLSEVREIMSGAFISRVGTPILFKPLEGETLFTIAANALRTAVFAAARNSGSAVDAVEVDPEAAELVVSHVRKKIVSYGARVILEQARLLAAEAYVDFMNSGLHPVRVRIAMKENRILISPN